MAYSNVITLVAMYLIICCFFSLLCADEARGGSHLERNYAMERLQRMGASIKSVQSGGAFAPLTRSNAMHIVSIGIGTPPMTLQGQMDTGTDLIWFQCEPFNPSAFDPQSSSTYRRVSCPSSLCSALDNSTCSPDCRYSHTYKESGSTQGDLSLETVTMADTSGASHSFRDVAFGCSHVVQGDGAEPVKGVVGLGRGQLSLLSQIGESKFSYCLPFYYRSLFYNSGFSTFDSYSTPLLFGSAAELNGMAVQSTMIINNTVLPHLNTYYYLSVRGISVGNVSLNISAGTFDIKANGSGGFIIDSGTPYTLLPHAAFATVASVLDSALSLPRANLSRNGLTLCYSSPYYDYFPRLNITFHMAGADYVIEGERNFVKFYVANLPVLCLAMVEGSVTGVPAVLGSFQQQDYHILYDNANQRLSFTPTRCRSLYMSTETEYEQSNAPILILGCHLLSPLLLLYFVALSLGL